MACTNMKELECQYSWEQSTSISYLVPVRHSVHTLSWLFTWSEFSSTLSTTCCVAWSLMEKASLCAPDL